MDPKAKTLRLQNLFKAINDNLPITNNVNFVDYVQDFLMEMYSIFEQKYGKVGQSSKPKVSFDSLGRQKLHIWLLLPKGKQTASQNTNYSQFL